MIRSTSYAFAEGGVLPIILAAGEGRRLRPLTDDCPKCLVAYKGKPLLHYTLTALSGAGTRAPLLVTGHRAERLAETGFPTVHNPGYASSNMVHSLFCAEEHLQGDIIISYSDIAYRCDVVRSLLASEAPISVVIDKEWRSLWQQRMVDVLADAETLKIDEAGNITELGKKPRSLEEIEGQYIGLFKIRASAWEPVRELYHSLGDDAIYDGRPRRTMFMTSFLQLIIDRLMPVAAVPIRGGWIEIDSIADLACEVEL